MAFPVRIAILLTAAVAAAAVVAGCGDDTDSPATTGTAGAATGPSGAAQIDAVLTGADSWTLAGGDGEPVIEGGAPVTLAFGADLTSASGQGPCNTYTGPVARTGEDGIRFARPATTLIACDGPAGTAEGEYLRALEAVRTVAVEGERRMTLSGDGVRLVYRALELPEALVGEWDVTGYRGRPDALTSVLLGTAPVLVFAADGTLALRGCNTFRSTWTLSGRDLAVAPGASTKKLCTEPEGVMEQDAGLAASVEASSTVEVTPAALTIRDAEDGMVITASRR